MELKTITAQTISQVDFTEIADSILDRMVNQAGSAFETVMDKFETYLDQTGTDEVQKQAAYAQFMKDTYSDINKQALSSAMDLLKTNAQLSYEKWKIESEYNLTNTRAAKENEELTLVGLTATKMQKENELLELNKLSTNMQILEERAKLKKQYGVLEQINYTLGDGNSNYKQYTDGLWYKINDNNEFVKENGDATTTPDSNGVVATITSMSMSTDVIDTATDGAIDKQIKGYDLVNYKDVLKTLDERAALMQNAKVAPTVNENLARNALIQEIANGVPGMPDTLGD